MIGPGITISVEGLCVGLNGLSILRDVTFSIVKGQMLALVGESGCGKSMTGASIMGIAPPVARIQSGHIFFGGNDLLQLTERDLRRIRGKRIALIPQEPMTALNPVLSVGDQLAEVLIRHEAFSRKQARARGIDLLEVVQIPEPQRRFDDYPHRLSGGMRQRVMIAMAVACNPTLLVADEPTTALDVTIQAQILELIDDLRRKLEMSVLLITHDLGIVAEWADRVAVMYAGQIVEQNAARSFFSKPEHPYFAALLSCSRALEGERHYTTGRLPEIKGSVTSAYAATGCRYAPRCAVAEDRCVKASPEELLKEGPERSVACLKPGTQNIDEIHDAAFG